MNRRIKRKGHQTKKHLLLGTNCLLPFKTRQQVRKLYASGFYTQAMLADVYGVSVGTVGKIVNSTEEEP